MIRRLIDSFFELGISGKIRVCILTILSIILLRELFYCIIDGMIHTIFGFGVLAVGTSVVRHLKYETDEYKYKGMTIIGTMATLFFLIIIGWSGVKFDTIEVINVGLGHMHVNVLGNEMFLVSNGREAIISELASDGIEDLYLVNSKNSDEIVIKHYTSLYPELEAKYDEYNGLIFTVRGSDEPVIITTRLNEQYFYRAELNLWSIRCYDVKYKSKNIFGQDGFYQYKEYFYEN